MYGVLACIVNEQLTRRLNIKANTMNREIKFRAWNGKTMEYPIEFGFNSTTKWKYICYDFGYEWYDKGSEVYMQYTGLKDKNGKEIYEGDIVELITYHSSPNYNGNKPPFELPRKTQVIEYYDCKFVSYTPKENPQPLSNYGYSDLYNIGDYKYEVIGNIHENPELL